MSDFFDVLGGGSQNEVADEKAGGDDEAFESTEAKCIKLYRVSDAGGSVQVTEVGEKPLSHDLLDTNVSVCTEIYTGFCTNRILRYNFLLSLLILIYHLYCFVLEVPTKSYIPI